MKLGINVDHIATLRQARKEGFPDPVLSAKQAIAAGADGIVCHLREDRRHINDKDVFALRKLKTRLDLEMAVTPFMVSFALKIKPNMVTLVPEKRQEVTTEGGLNVSGQLNKIKKAVTKLQKRGIVVSLFVDPVISQIKACAKTNAKFIEIHTGAYANAITKTKRKKELDKIKEITKLALDLRLRVNAGHGLDYSNVRAIARIVGMEELNIGFSVIVKAVEVGMYEAVKLMINSIKHSN